MVAEEVARPCPCPRAGVGIGDSDAGERGGVRVVGGGRGEEGVGEEAVVEEGAFEEEVGEGVEEVPDVEDAEFGRGGAVWEEAEGDEVGG